MPERYALEGHVIATATGKQLAGLAFRHPLFEVDAGYQRLSTVMLAEYVSADDGTGIVHWRQPTASTTSTPAWAHGMAYDQILNPVQGNGQYEAELPLFGGPTSGRPARSSLDAQDNERLLATKTITHSYPTAGATRRR